MQKTLPGQKEGEPFLRRKSFSCSFFCFLRVAITPREIRQTMTLDSHPAALRNAPINQEPACNDFLLPLLLFSKETQGTGNTRAERFHECFSGHRSHQRKCRSPRRGCKCPGPILSLNGTHLSTQDIFILPFRQGSQNPAHASPFLVLSS